MKLYKCNYCNQLVEMPDNERLIIHICGSGDVDRICSQCQNLLEEDQQKCKFCKYHPVALQVYEGNISLVDAILNL